MYRVGRDRYPSKITSTRTDTSEPPFSKGGKSVTAPEGPAASKGSSTQQFTTTHSYSTYPSSGTGASSKGEPHKGSKPRTCRMLHPIAMPNIRPAHRQAHAIANESSPDSHTGTSGPAKIPKRPISTMVHTRNFSRPYDHDSLEPRHRSNHGIPPTAPTSQVQTTLVELILQ